ncbi:MULTISPECIES: substrate-binding domain-containing protein [Streptomycetaceae]|uniref:Sugar ABC transporter substrate-binding protein n=1 Tax=Streptantibioticus cattleyicolor (strain ATCC 35852 / DSM 46488 / JCM 4925 / NBRC 14057 / NRRL 8057) TaxID=1003195 RepID=F8JRQ9_STREN|nr:MULTISPECIES: substrate-binding domain-containing protein [Streptomycetaceae]AEW97164.1 sugar ABC transporter substrate-binding protein [Streptantibioticus cattleyicolor NRRL 8057 = DSM 46488]MYS61621.1 substrate-binding domain-containing protein [Streptomyces sp. SID5468]CCB77487.1 putative simple sugar ABC transporter substrate-binding protein [Streptantibioticus cattleyicolor NRRL 8057 = DSM 46488]
MERTARSRGAVVLAACAAGAVLVAGCASSTGGKRARDAAGSLAAGHATTPRMKVAMVTHGGPGDTFWDLVRKGAQTAAAKDNVDLVYASDPNAANQANLVQNAVDQKVDGIVVTLAKPDAMKGVTAKAEQAGIPVVGVNAGLDAWRAQGLLEFFGQDENVAGQAFGDKLNQLGAKHALCVIHEQGNVSLADRCAGVRRTFHGTTDLLYVNGTDMPSVKSTLTAKLQQDHSVDEVVTLGAPYALTAAQAVSDAGAKAAVATFDLDKALVPAIRAGTVQFAVDQQPFLQGYLAVDGLWLYKNNGDTSGGGRQPVLTGPAFVDKDNIGSVAKYAENGTR